MRRFLAVLKDSLQETLDCKIFYVLIAFSLLIILVLLTCKFETRSTQEILERIVL